MLINASLRTRRETDGVIYLTLISRGLTGPEWIDLIGKKGFSTYSSRSVAKVLMSPDFKPLTAGTNIDVAILPDTFCSESELTMANINAEAVRRGWVKTHAEIACLIRENVSNKDMENIELCYIMAVHDPIEHKFLVSSWRNGGELSTFGENENPLTSRQWGRNRGYVFTVPSIA